MIKFSCEGLNCSAKIEIPDDNARNFKCPKCNRKYDSDEGKNIFFQEELDKFLEENLYQEDYLELRLALENDLNAFISDSTIVFTHLANTKKKVSTQEFKQNLKEFGNKLKDIKFQIPKPLDLGVVRKNEKKYPGEPKNKAHEILIYEANYKDHLDNGLGKDTRSASHNYWLEDKKEYEHQIRRRTEHLKEMFPKFDLNEHRKKFKTVKPISTGIVEIKKK